MKLNANRISDSRILAMILFLKIFSDMFYQIQLLDIVLTAAAVFLLGYGWYTRKPKLIACDILIAAMALLFTISFLKDIGYYRDYVKIMSGFMMYYLGRLYYESSDGVSKSAASALVIVFVINLAYCAIGKGTIMWGNALTYRGLYFFKTDFAAMLACFTAFYSVTEQKYRPIRYLLLALAGVMIVLTNARIYCPIFTVIIGAAIIYKKDWKLLSVKSFAVLILSGIAGVLIAVVYPMLSTLLSRNVFGQDRNVLGVEVGDTSALTQGRNKIWGLLFSAFFKENMLTQLFGAHMGFYAVHGLPGFDEHSMYVKTIMDTGYVGIILWLTFVVCVLWAITKIKDRKTAILSFMLLMTYSAAGISVSANAFTQTSWFPMLFCGIVYGQIQKDFTPDIRKTK